MKSHARLLRRLVLGGTLLGIISLPARSAPTPTPPEDARERAVTALQDDLKGDPTNAELWLHLGFAYRKLNQIDKAQEAFEKAATLRPQEKDSFFMLGLIYESKQKNEEAQRAWKNYLALETDPEKRAIAEKHIHHLEQ